MTLKATRAKKQYEASKRGQTIAATSNIEYAPQMASTLGGEGLRPLARQKNIITNTQTTVGTYQRKQAQTRNRKLK